MCSSKSKVVLQKSSSINGGSHRPVLQPNRSPLLERCNSINPGGGLLIHNNVSSSTSIEGAAAVIIDLLQPINKVVTKPNKSRLTTTKSMSRTTTEHHHHHSSISSLKYTSSAIVDSPGSIAAARREQVAIIQEQRKLRISHYGRSKSSSNLHHHHYPSSLPTNHFQRCTFITPYSDPIYVAYHDEEWGVPVHDDNMLFELLVLNGGQVGSDWSSVLRKRRDLREAFSSFDAEIVSKFTEKKMNIISAEYCVELSLVRGVVDNAKRILEMKKEFGTLDKYLWGFVNHKAIVTQYKWCQKIPAKTSKSETISKDMVRRGFRQVGPTVVHSFMQAAGLTNDHLITCPSHSLIKLNY